MKRPEYGCRRNGGKARYCRRSGPDGRGAAARRILRSGFTDGYFTDQRGSAMFGVRSKADVTAAKDVLRDLAHTYEKSSPCWD